jgi:hypothetical protein
MQLKRRTHITAFLLYLCCQFSLQLLQAQPNTEKGLNLPKFYSQKIHFGFSIGLNQTDFRLHTVPNSKLPHDVHDTILYPNDTLNLKSVQSKAEPGFNLGIICDARLHQYVRIRFLPNIAFASRSLQYNFTGTRTFTVSKKSESTFINLPLNVKLQSKRLRNFGAYLIGGGSYSIDLASGKKDAASNEVVRLKSNDLYYEGGAGADFYLPYFKLGLELKLITGITNILIKDNTFFTTPINKLNSRIFLFSITFEG